MKVYWCRVHDSNSESFIARCFYALWASALDKCELKEMALRPLVQELRAGDGSLVGILEFDE